MDLLIVMVAVLSSSLSMIYPAMAKDSLEAFGQYGGVFFIYLTTSVSLGLWLLVSRERRSSMLRTLRHGRSKNGRGALAGALIFSVIGVLLYYRGLDEYEGHCKLAYAYFGRLRCFLLFFFAAFLLREKVGLRHWIGALIVFGGILLLFEATEMESSVIVFGLSFVVAMAISDHFFKVALRGASTVDILILRQFVVTMCFGALLLCCSSVRLEFREMDIMAAGAVSTALTAVLLLSIFASKFYALKNMSLSFFACTSGFSVVFVAGLSWFRGSALSQNVLLALVIACVGEAIAYRDSAKLLEGQSEDLPKKAMEAIE